MAHITNQWLKGEVERGRNHSPIKVTTVVSKAPDKDRWSTKNLVVTDLNLLKDNGDYHCVSLTQTDLSNLLPLLVSYSDEPTQVKTALNAIQKLSDAMLLEFMAKAFSERADSK